MEPGTVVLPRRPHVKSRSGCIECKRRRIKCGEERPACNNCARFSKQSECVFIVPQKRAKPRARSKSATIPSPAASSDSNVHVQVHAIANATINNNNNTNLFINSTTTTPNSTSSSTTTSTPTIPPSLPEVELPALNYVELRLMLQFCNSTHISLTSSIEFQHMWRNDLCEYALKHEFVTRSMLALSALELARSQDDAKEAQFYTAHAMQQHQTALRQAHEALEHATADNCSALHMFSGLAFIFTMAKPREGMRALFGESSIMAEWFSIMAGIQAIRASFSDDLDAGPHGRMLLAARTAQSQRVARARQEPLVHQLECLVRTHVVDTDELAVYMHSIDYLHVCFDHMTGDDGQDIMFECADAFSWFFAVSRDFIALLKSGAQEALAIFAFASTLFLKIERFWWARGWSRYLVAEAYEGLDQLHREWVRWPMEQVGLVAPLSPPVGLYCSEFDEEAI